MTDQSHRRKPAPEAVAYVGRLMSELARPWFLCGGWALDAWLGRQTRDHLDVDIAVFVTDQRAVFEHLAGWAMVGHDPNVPDDTTEPWNGRRLDLPAHIHVPRRRSVMATATTGTHTAFEFEFLLNDPTWSDWILNRDQDIRRPLDRCSWRSSWGLAVLAPEVVLFYKAGGNLGPEELGEIRSHDERDFLAALPTLTESQRHWLHDALARVHGEHPWLHRLRS